MYRFEPEYRDQMIMWAPKATHNNRRAFRNVQNNGTRSFL